MRNRENKVSTVFNNNLGGKEMFKKALSTLLAVAMVVTMLPMNVFATSEEPVAEPAIVETVPAEPVAEAPKAETPAEPVAEAPKADVPEAEAPESEDPAGETLEEGELAGETPEEGEPTGETPEEDELAGETPEEDELAGETPETEKPAEEPTVEEEPVAFYENININGTKIEISAEAGIFPNGTTVNVVEVTSAVQGAIEGAVDGEITAMRAFDITFFNANGEEIQPNGNVNVSFKLSVADLPAAAAADKTEVYHMADVNASPEKVAQTSASDSVSINVNSFSIYTIAEVSQAQRKPGGNNDIEIKTFKLEASAGETIELVSTHQGPTTDKKGWKVESGASNLKGGVTAGANKKVGGKTVGTASVTINDNADAGTTIEVVRERQGDKNNQGYKETFIITVKAKTPETPKTVTAKFYIHKIAQEDIDQLEAYGTAPQSDSNYFPSANNGLAKAITVPTDEVSNWGKTDNYTWRTWIFSRGSNIEKWIGDNAPTLSQFANTDGVPNDINCNDPNLEVVWYVIKDQKDGWHVDGYVLTKYTINYELNGGALAEGVTNPTVYTASDAFTLNNPQKPGYTFLGWTGSNGADAETSVSITRGTTGNKEYTANWAPYTYTVEFDGNGGEGTMDDMSFNFDEEKTLDENEFERSGFAFIGWSTQPDGEVEFEDEESVKNLCDENGGTVTLYAQWEQTEYKVDYQWTTDAPSGTTKPGDDVANSENSFKVIVDDNYKENQVVVVTTYGMFGWQTDKYYKFSGWKLNGNVVSGELTISSDTTLTGSWIEVSYRDIVSLQYYGNGNDGGSAPAEKSYYVKGANVKVLANTYTKNGYTFVKWNDNSNGRGNSYNPDGTITLYSSKTLYAQWAPNGYTVKFNANGGEGTMNDMSFKFNETKKLTANAFTRTDYRFIGWSTQADGNVAYSNEARVKNLTNEKDGVVTLYAQWEQIPPTVTYSWSGNIPTGVSLPSSSEATKTNNGFEHSINTSYNSNSVRTTVAGRYTFSGWNTVSGGTISGGKVVGITDDITVSGTWTFTPYEFTVRYFGNGGSGVVTDTNTYHYGDTVTLLANGFSRENHEFDGWTINGTKYEPNDTITIKGNVNVYADWEFLGYSVTYNWGTVAPAGETKPADGRTSYSLPYGEYFDYDTKYTKGYTVTDETGTYVFSGWSISGDYFGIGTIFDWFHGTKIWGISSNIAITGSWQFTPEVYDIVYNLDGGALEAGKSNPTTYTVNDEFTLVNPQKEGFAFLGWTGSNGTDADTDVSITKGTTGDKEYTANWTPKTNSRYTVNHYLQNAENDEYTFDSYDLLTGTTNTDTDAKAKVFENFIAQDIENQKIEADGSTVVNVYYDREKFDVVYMDGTTQLGATESYKFGQNVTIRAAASKSGYNFNGWFTEDGEAAKDFVMPTQNVTIYARWSAIPTPPVTPPVTPPTTPPTVIPPITPPLAPPEDVFTVTFVDYDGTVIRTGTFELGDTVSFPAGPSRENYDFSDWTFATGTELGVGNTVQGDATYMASYMSTMDRTINDPSIPLADGGNGWAILNLILTVITALTSVLMIVGYFTKKKNGKKETTKSKTAARFGTLVPALGAIITFILTENMNSKMIFSDKYTLLMAAIALLGVAVSAFAISEKKNKAKAK